MTILGVADLLVMLMMMKMMMMMMEMMMMMTNTTEPRREYVRRNAAGRKNIGKSRQPQRANCIIVESVHPKT